MFRALTSATALVHRFGNGLSTAASTGTMPIRLSRQQTKLFWFGPQMSLATLENPLSFGIDLRGLLQFLPQRILLC
ncbi:MAG TPA: hypothetical protein VF631_11935 [Allosphingosinicella sp.]